MRTQAFRLALATGQMRAVMLLLVPVLQVLALVVLAPLVLQVLLLLAPSLLVQVMLSLVVVVILVVAQEEQVAAAEKAVGEVAEKLGLRPLADSGGKLETYIRQKCPKHLEVLVAKGYLKP